MIKDQLEFKLEEAEVDDIDDLEVSDKFFSEISNIMYTKRFTLLKLLKGKIFDLMINN